MQAFLSFFETGVILVLTTTYDGWPSVAFSGEGEEGEGMFLFLNRHTSFY